MRAYLNNGAPRPLRVIVGHECSGRVRDAFLSRGHLAWSADLKASEVGGPHLVGDVFNYLNAAPDGHAWDIGIFHPDCTFLCSSGLHWNTRRPGRSERTAAALDDVRRIMGCGIPRIAIENPMGRIGTAIRKADQYIQPYQFGDDASKLTGLWLIGLPALVVPPSREWVPPRLICRTCGRRADTIAPHAACCLKPRMAKRWGNQTDTGQNRLGPSATRAADRARTYPGIANAMALLWGGPFTINSPVAQGLFT